MRICVLNDTYLESNSVFKAWDGEVDPAYYLPEHAVEMVSLTKARAIEQVRGLYRQGFDVFINLCDAAPDEDRPGVEVVETLEELGAAFTGANVHFYNPSREDMKQVCRRMDITTPGSVMVSSLAGLEKAVEHLRYPLIVKHYNSYGSIGLSRSSRVENFEDLYQKAAQMLEAFQGALIEEFIDGREFSVLVAENPDDPGCPVAFPAVEILFPAGESFKHFDLKWAGYSGMQIVPCSDPVLNGRMGQMSKDLFLGIGGRSYGRCDLRVDNQGRPYMLEINPNCGVLFAPGLEGMADHILNFSTGKHAYFLDLILRSALKHRR